MLGQGHTFCLVQGSQQISPLASQREFKGAKISSSRTPDSRDAGFKPLEKCPGSIPSPCLLVGRLLSSQGLQLDSAASAPCFLRTRQPPPSRALATHPGKRAAAPEPGRPEGHASCLRRLVESLATAGVGCWTSEHALGAGGEQRR